MSYQTKRSPSHTYCSKLIGTWLAENCTSAEVKHGQYNGNLVVTLAQFSKRNPETDQVYDLNVEVEINTTRCADSFASSSLVFRQGEVLARVEKCDPLSIKYKFTRHYHPAHCYRALETLYAFFQDYQETVGELWEEYNFTIENADEFLEQCFYKIN